jgi:hypothetical protein
VIVSVVSCYPPTLGMLANSRSYLLFSVLWVFPFSPAKMAGQNDSDKGGKSDKRRSKIVSYWCVCHASKTPKNPCFLRKMPGYRNETEGDFCPVG